LKALARSDTQFVAVGEHGTILRSLGPATITLPTVNTSGGGGSTSGSSSSGGGAIGLWVLLGLLGLSLSRAGTRARWHS